MTGLDKIFKHDKNGGKNKILVYKNKPYKPYSPNRMRPQRNVS